MKNQRGIAPLHTAANSGSEIITILLLEAGADPNIKDSSVCIFIPNLLLKCKGNYLDFKNTN